MDTGLFIFILSMLGFIFCSIVCFILSLISSGLLWSQSDTISFKLCKFWYQITTLGEALDVGRMGAQCGGDPEGQMLPLGAVCSSNEECESGNCVGGGILGAGILGDDTCGEEGESGFLGGLFR